MNIWHQQNEKATINNIRSRLISATFRSVNHVPREANSLTHDIYCPLTLCFFVLWKHPYLAISLIPSSLHIFFDIFTKKKGLYIYILFISSKSELISKLVQKLLKFTSYQSITTISIKFLYLKRIFFFFF